MARITLQITPYGGVLGATVMSIVGEVAAANARGHTMIVLSTGGDSLLPRRRSIILSQFMEGPTDAIVTVDHDVSWVPGDAYKIAERAMELDAVVGGLYSKRQEGGGWASRFLPKATGSFKIPSDAMLDTLYAGSGFMAISKTAVRKILEDPEKHLLTRCWNGYYEYWDLYHTMAVPHTADPSKMEYLSEDWAFCFRARLAGVPILTDLRARIKHYGERFYTAADGIPKPKPAPTDNSGNTEPVKEG